LSLNQAIPDEYFIKAHISSGAKPGQKLKRRECRAKKTKESSLLHTSAFKTTKTVHWKSTKGGYTQNPL